MAQDRFRRMDVGSPVEAEGGVSHDSVFTMAAPGQDGRAFSIAQGVLNGLRNGMVPPEDARPTIEEALLGAGDSEVLSAYATVVLGRPWPQAEACIAAGELSHAMPYWKGALGCQPWPAMEDSMVRMAGRDSGLAHVAAYVAERPERRGAILAGTLQRILDHPDPKIAPSWRRIDAISNVGRMLAGGRWPEGDKAILGIVTASIDVGDEGAVEAASHHALETRGGAWPELEAELLGRIPLEGGRLRGAVLHATIGRQGVWPALDYAAIASGPVACALVAAAVSGERRADMESTILSSVRQTDGAHLKDGMWSAMAYAKGVGLRDWPEMEDALMERARMGDPGPAVRWVAEVSRKPLLGLSDCIQGDHRLAALYADLGRPTLRESFEGLEI